MTPIRHGTRFWRQGEPLVWATGGTLAFVLLSTVLLIGVVLVHGLGVFWPSPVAEITLADGTRFHGQQVQTETHPGTGGVSVQFKTANRELDPQRLDFRWVAQEALHRLDYPADVMVVERLENGSFFGCLERVDAAGLDLPADVPVLEQLVAALTAVRSERAARIAPLAAQIQTLNRELQRVQDTLLRLRYRRQRSVEQPDAAADANATCDAAIARAAARQQELQARSDELGAEQRAVAAALRQATAVFRLPSGDTHNVAVADMVRVWQPNAMSVWAKCRHYAAKVWELLSDEPRESNTEGGLFPAIFGTVMLVFLMAWITDGGAYFVGSKLGRHKLIVRVSPKKTVEGTVGGVISCIIFTVVFGFIAGMVTSAVPNYPALIIMAALVSIVSQMGDLIASLFKREFGIKDYGNVFPGHGGVMDRFDSNIVVAPFMFIMINALPFLTLFV